MPIVVALLRGINVGGHKKIKMADLRELLAALGMRNARTILQSGNAVFYADESDLAALKTRLEAGIHNSFGFDVVCILRTGDEFKSTLRSQPFTEAQLTQPNKAAMVFLSDVAQPAAVDRLRENNPGREIIHAAGRELFIYYTDGMARSKLDNKRIERALGVGTTMRNWNTCGRIVKLLDEMAAQASRST